MRIFFKSLLAAFLLLTAIPAFAVDGVMSPNVQKGELGTENLGKYSTDDNPALNGKSEQQFDLSYGLTDRWRMRGDATLNQTPDNNFVYRSFKFANIYQFSKIRDGHYLDMAAYNNISLAGRAGDANDVSLGLLARKEFGDFLHTADFYVKKDWGQGTVPGVNMITRWQTRYSAMPETQPGIEIFSDTAKHEALKQQTFSIGPVLYGAFDLGDSKNITYEVGYVFGVTRATADGTAIWKIKYGLLL